MSWATVVAERKKVRTGYEEVYNYHPLQALKLISNTFLVLNKKKNKTVCASESLKDLEGETFHHLGGAQRART